MPICDHIGTFNENTALEGVSQLILLAAGTGFTPMARLIQRFVKTCTKSSVCQLVFFNKAEKDVIWREQLDDLEKKSGLTFRVTYVMSEDNGWLGYKGRISEQILRETLPQWDGGKRLAGVCGPNPFTQTAEK